ncbi:hypothetical protein C8P63_11614 [Melghirimyces profundicolus]|uniref:Uncharacterized protein n=1 Tax=Melghirimyces profundicolus TaxID=1242148 RepID=A0A2T6BR16_9BACL|nr:hypothetical protein C8P63_11614 [Melghirimyces profundicolus]
MITGNHQLKITAQIRLDEYLQLGLWEESRRKPLLKNSTSRVYERNGVK